MFAFAGEEQCDEDEGGFDTSVLGTVTNVVVQVALNLLGVLTFGGKGVM